jgi:hypothetical protein
MSAFSRAARAAGLSNKGSRQTLAGLSLDEEMDCGCQHPTVLLDESSGPTSGTKRNWPQIRRKQEREFLCGGFFIRVHLRSSVAKFVLPAVQPKGSPRLQSFI